MLIGNTKNSLTKSVNNMIKIPKKNFFNVTKSNNNIKDMFYTPIDNGDSNTQLSILKYGFQMKPLKKVIPNQSRNMSCKYLQGKISLEGTTIPTKKNADDSLTISKKAIHLLHIKVRSNDNINNDALFNKDMLHKKNKMMSIKIIVQDKQIDANTANQCDKVITSHIKNMQDNTGRKLNGSEHEVIININIKDRPHPPQEEKKSNKKDSVMPRGCYNNINSLNNKQHQIKYFLDNIDYYSMDLLSMKQTMEYISNSKCQSMANILSKKKNSECNLGQTRNHLGKYPIYFLPDLAQGLLEQTHK